MVTTDLIIIIYVIIVGKILGFILLANLFRIDKYTKARGYTKAIVTSDLYNGFIDADDEETEWLERSDSEIDIKEIIGKDLKKDEKN